MHISRKPEKGKIADLESMNASFNGTPYNTEHLVALSICAAVDETSASLAGTLKLQASNNCFSDNVSNELRTDTAWVDIPASAMVLTSGDTNVMWNISDLNYEAVRVVWTRTSGQGTISVYYLAKGWAS